MEYDKTCHFSDWEKYCEGKFLEFPGNVEGVDSLKHSVKVAVGDTHGFIVNAVTNAGDFQEGQRVQFSGYLSDHGMVTDGLSDGQIIPLESRAAAQSRIDEKEAEQRARVQREDAELNQEVDTAMTRRDRILSAMDACDPSAAAGIQAFYQCLDSQGITAADLAWAKQVTGD